MTIQSAPLARGSSADSGASHAQLRLVRSADGKVTTPRFLGGLVSEQAPVLSSGGTRLLAPSSVHCLCYSVKTLRQVGVLTGHEGKVLSVAAAPSQSLDRMDLVATGCAAGELRIWDTKTLACLSSLRLDAPISALRWPQSDFLYAVLRPPGKKLEVRKIDVRSLGSPQATETIPLTSEAASFLTAESQASRLLAFDASSDVVVIADGYELCVWVETWPRCIRLRSAHEKRLTSVSIDPMRRYVTAGDEHGVIWSWWGVLDSFDPDARQTPSKFHWHCGPVRALAHLGPIVLSGGDEAVLVYRRSDNDTPSFVPRFLAPLRHISVSPDGHCFCISLANNSLAIVDDLHNWVRPRYIHAVAVPVGLGLPGGDSSARLLPGSRERLTGLRRPVLHQLPEGSNFALTGSELTVQFLDKDGSVLPSVVTLRKENYARSVSGNVDRRWSLWHVAFGAGLSSLMTVERRFSPTLFQHDVESAESFVVKWWRRDVAEGEPFSVSSLVNNPHTAEVTVALAHPRRENFFVTGSADGEFKCWDLLQVESGSTSMCWQCVAVGSWHLRPVLCGQFCMDGSVLALGFHGFVVLWEAELAKELQAIALVDADTLCSQLTFAMAAGHFLLLAGTRSATIGGTSQQSCEMITCWDMLTLEVVARLNPSEVCGDPALGCAAFRVDAAGLCGGDGVHLLLYREATNVEVAEREGAGKEGICELQVWRLLPGGSGFTMHSSGKLPRGCQVVDATFVEGPGQSPRVLCWMTDFELLALDLNQREVAGQDKRQDAGVLEEDDATSRPRAKVSRLVGGITAKIGARATSGPTLLRELLAPELRTTAVQQAGILPRFLEQVLPPHVPSHLLPPPAVLQAGVLNMLAKQISGAGTTAHLSSETLAAQELSNEPRKFGSKVLLPLPLACKGELVSSEWMTELVKEALC